MTLAKIITLVAAVASVVTGLAGSFTGTVNAVLVAAGIFLGAVVTGLQTYEKVEANKLEVTKQASGLK